MTKLGLQTLGYLSQGPLPWIRPIWMVLSSHKIHLTDPTLKSKIRKTPWESPSPALGYILKINIYYWGESMLKLNVPRCGYLKEMISVLFECALAISMARSLASEPLFNRKMT